MPEATKFVEQKNLAAELKNCVKNWERKIEIAEVAAKKAIVILKKTGEHVEELQKPGVIYEEDN